VAVESTVEIPYVGIVQHPSNTLSRSLQAGNFLAVFHVELGWENADIRSIVNSLGAVMSQLAQC